MQLIDDAGHLLAVSARLQAGFGTRLPAQEFADYMVRNLGWVSIAKTKSTCEVRLRPTKVKDRALLGAVDQLRATSAHRFLVSTFTDRWSTASLDDASEATRHLMSLIHRVQVASRSRDFLRRPRRRSNIADRTPEAILLDAWGTGVQRVETLARIADGLFAGRYIIAGRDGVGATCILANGPDFNIIGESWMSRVPHLRLTDWPDVAYGQWAEQGYQEAWRSETPLLDALDCDIEWPSLGRRRHRYARIVLPCWSASGTRLLIGAMRNDPLIDLRSELH